MKFILHLGSSKTGSTALQSSLAKARDALEKEGVWYPQVEKRVSRRQNILATPFQRKTQRVYAGKTFDGLSPEDYAEAAWTRIAEHAKEYDTVIISSEFLGAIPEVERFGDYFRERFPDADVTAIYYLRRPSKHAASRMQQRISANHNLTEFRPVNYFRVVKNWKKIFPVVLREFSPGTLVGGTIAKDFSQATGLKVELPEIRKNESLSAEAMQIIQDYRMKYHNNRTDKNTPDILDIKGIFKKLESEAGRKAILKEDIAASLDSLEFVHKLKDQFGFEFEGLDYTKAIVEHEALEHIFGKTQVRDYMVFDEERLRELHLEVLHAIFAEQGALV